jgi:site-specific DNA-cytosine methylase
MVWRVIVITLRTDFAGGGLVDIGYRAAGLIPVYAVELDPAKCEVYRANHGDHIVCARVEDVDPYQMADKPSAYHVSPSCKNASQANTNKGESPEDLSAAEAVCRNIRVLQPKVFTLENVRQYEGFQAFKLIVNTLRSLNYRVRWQVVCAADYGVPQTRDRLILVATAPGMPAFEWPEPTHHEGEYFEQATLFGDTKVLRPWIGWYEAIEDLLPSLPESEFADWQLARLPQLFQNTLVSSGSSHFSGEEKRVAHRAGDEPALVVTGSSANRVRGFLIDSQNAGREITVRNGDLPAWTVTSAMAAKGMPKGLLVDCVHRTDAPLTVREDSEPSFTVSATAMRRDSNTAKALLVEGQLGSGGTHLNTRGSDRPVWTITASTGTRKPAKAWLEQGRVVRMTVHALARFQMNHHADTYKFTGKTKLDCEIVGNGVPVLVAEAFGRQIVRLFE